MSIIPICIFHRVDPDTKSYLGYISEPEKVHLGNGKDIYECKNTRQSTHYWFHSETFYAIAPSFRPIPVGTRIFCAKRNNAYPYDTIDVMPMYDPFNIKPDCVYFITFNQPVPNTVPLYLHKMGDHVFPTFHPQPPDDHPDWTQTQISPIFVMTSNTVGNISKISDLNFKCINGHCIPWVKNIPNLYDPEPHEELLDIDKCVIFCNELAPVKNKGRPSSLMEFIRQDTQPKKSSVAIILSVSIFLMLFVLYLYVKK